MENEKRIELLTKKYRIERNGHYDMNNRTMIYDGTIRISPKPNDADLAEIRLLKPEIIEFLMAKQIAMEERENKIKNIEGLTELLNTIEQWERYHVEFARRMQNENLSYQMPTAPKTKVEEVAKQYPRAAAYLKAESYNNASHYAKSAAGRKAVERIINGEDYNTVINEMDAEWSNYCDEHKFDN